MSADAGADHRAMLALQARVSETLAAQVRLDADVVKLKGQVAALSLRVRDLENPEPEKTALHNPDQDRLSEADRDAMRKRLQARTLAGIEANKTDRNRAGRTYRRNSGVK